MSRYSRNKEKYVVRSEISKGYYDQGTAARTRPLSFDEIMSKRKVKQKLSDSEKEGVAEGVSGDGDVGNISERGHERSKDRNAENNPKRGSERSKDGSPQKNLERFSGRSKDGDTGNVYDRSSGRGKNRNAEKNLERGNDRSKDVNNETFSERGNKRGKDSSPDVQKHLSERDAKVSSKMKEENISMKDHYLNKNRYQENYDSETKLKMKMDRDFKDKGKTEEKDHDRKKGNDLIKSRDREIHSSVTKLKGKLDRDLKDKGKIEEKDHDRKKGNDLGKSRDRETHSSVTKLKGKLDRDLKAKDNTENVHDSRKKDEWRSNNDKDEALKKQSRNLTERDKHVDRSRRNPEGERKYRNGVDEKDRDEYLTRKHDLGNSKSKNNREHQFPIDSKERDGRVTRKCDPGEGNNAETLDTEEMNESSRSRYEEIKVKSRRPRSREHVERKRTSISPLPRSKKHASHHGKHGDRDFHHLKGNSGQKHPDVDRTETTDNGLNDHYKKHSGSTSGLSPRKRRTEAFARTSSPPKHSPGKKRAKWDLAPEGADTASSVSVPLFLQLPNQTAFPNIHEPVDAVPVAPVIVKPFSGVSSSYLSTNKSYSTDSVQLTQATRPMRRLYVENIPVAIAEKTMMEWFNNLLISSGVNHILGTRPCISCIIHKEKAQALVEFLTPEDASTALSFDGTSFSGSTIKIRRPKDFVEMATGDLEKLEAAVDVLRSIVKESPQTIFIGGISKALSSKMVMEIVGSFGPLRRFHFENNDDLDCPYAFVEYTDQSIASKACAGLNGMKIGGQVISVVQIVPDASTLESDRKPPFYEIPKQAKPLLEKPMQVLKLKNVFDPEILASMSDTEIEEVVEDVRLECARFGTVKSVNFVKHGESPVSNTEACEVNENLESAGSQENLRGDETNAESETTKEAVDYKSVEGNDFEHDKHADDLMGEQSDRNTLESKVLSQQTLKDESDCTRDGVMEIVEMKETSMEDKLPIEEELNLEELRGKLTETFVDDHVRESNTSKGEQNCEEETNLEEVGGKLKETEKEGIRKQNYEEESILEGAGKKLNLTVAGDRIIGSDAVGEGDHRKQNGDLGRIFEAGCVFVEFGRTEAACAAAHSLHGRSFDSRTVTVGYVSLDAYRSRFLGTG
ncbi:uncharacterized protein LOC126667586 isoform X2 [Mercurialis annua]|uniref:uncharacterized protein LOC126667586 isoform X2 n=1 Tax=Mercurialis annua TaxID=3986 RepID=UPI00215FA1C4|nr:uncharacterized protein LOC126667586 isoform X2 [Mercurialis annua]